MNDTALATNFETWNAQKQSIEKEPFVRYFHPREVWFLRMGKNIGFEQDGKGEKFLRPVLIYKKFSNRVFLGIPLTSKEKTGHHYTSFELNGKKNTLILSQIRLFDAKRLEYPLGRISEKSFSPIKESLIRLLR